MTAQLCWSAVTNGFYIVANDKIISWRDVKDPAAVNVEINRVVKLNNGISAGVPLEIEIELKD